MEIKTRSLMYATILVCASASQGAWAGYDPSAKWHAEYRAARDASLMATAQSEADSKNSESAKVLRSKAISLYKTTISDVPKDERYYNSVLYHIYRQLMEDQKSNGDTKGLKASEDIAAPMFETSTKEFPMFSSLPKEELNKTQRPSLEDMAAGTASKGPKSDKCPFCTKTDAIVPIQYGLIRPSKNAKPPAPQHDATKVLSTLLKKEHLGGCMIMPTTQHCNRCDVDFI